jgi:hypothetical protein
MEMGRLAIRPSRIQALVKEPEGEGLAPAYIETITRHVALKGRHR